MASKITLAQWPGTVSEPKVVSLPVQTVADTPLSNEERQLMIEALDVLHMEYKIGLNRLVRAVGLTSDLRSVFEKRRVVRLGLVEDIARVTGMSVLELRSIKNLSPQRQTEVRAHLKKYDLIEPDRGFTRRR